MKPRIHNRKLLLYDEEPHGTLSSPAFSDNNPPVPFSDTPAPAAVNATSTATSSSALSFTKPYKPLDSSLTLTLTILLAALFFMGFFSIYVRRFSDDDDESTVGNSLGRRGGSGSPPSPTSWPSDRRGLDLMTVRSLPVVPYHGDAKHRIDCTICLAEFEEGEAVKLVPHCKHVFHPGCIDRWLDSHVTCPLCRGTMSFGAKRTSRAGGGESVGQVASSVPGADTCIAVGSVGLRRTRSYFGQGGEDHVYIERALSF